MFSKSKKYAPSIAAAVLALATFSAPAHVKEKASEHDDVKKHFNIIQNIPVPDEQCYLQNVFLRFPLIEAGVLSITLPNGRPIVLPEKGRVTLIPKQGRFTISAIPNLLTISPPSGVIYMANSNGGVTKIDGGVTLSSDGMVNGNNFVNKMLVYTSNTHGIEMKNITNGEVVKTVPKGKRLAVLVDSSKFVKANDDKILNILNTIINNVRYHMTGMIFFAYCGRALPKDLSTLQSYNDERKKQIIKDINDRFFKLVGTLYGLSHYQEFDMTPRERITYGIAKMKKILADMAIKLPDSQ
ncbi:hypothetical protein BDF22DRAFT_656136 [Syncephalis plumigaleata]|nr:hypothetical protein BDF22DRAFT_656136 [Syncephalis plumigaleata]